MTTKVELKYKYNVVDMTGRKWARTLTRIKAARIVEMLREQKGVVCVIKENM